MRKVLWMAATAMVASTAVAAQDKSDEVIRAALKSLNADIKVEEIRPAPIAGLFEVTVPGQVVYITEDGKFLVQGMILDIPQKLDLTEQRRSELRRGLLAKAPSRKYLSAASCDSKRRRRASPHRM